MPSRSFSSRDQRRQVDFDAILDRAKPAFDCFYIDEPRLIFGGGFSAVDPKVGITDFGPLGTDPFSAKTVRLGIIGTGLSIDAAQAYLERCQERVKPGLNSKEKHYDSLCFPDFPGARPGVGLRARFLVSATRDIPLDRFERAVAGGNVAGKLRAVVELLEKQLEMLKAIEPVPDADFHEVPPRRVVLHKSSRYWPEELRGFERALDGVPRHDFLTLERLGHRFYRTGNAPPVRGTVITLAPRQHVLYTVGYVPALCAYPGARPPLPLEIIEHHGDSTADVVCREILALTKVNWNSCNFASTEPITLQFARTVGRVMRELPPDVPAARLYRFYM